MSLNARNFRELVVRPTLKAIGKWSPEAEELLMLTWAQETNGTYLRQGYKTLDDGRGVGLGPYSMEPDTHDDHWKWLLNPKRRELYDSIMSFAEVKTLLVPPSRQLVWNLAYATAMARVHYLRVPAPIPPAKEIEALAFYWDAFYNCNPDVGFPTDAIKNYRRYVLNVD